MKILCINSLDARYGSTYRIRALREALLKADLDVKYVETQENILSRFFRSLMIAAFGKYDLLLTQKFNPITIPTMILARLSFTPVIVDWDDIDADLQGCWSKRIVARFSEWIGPHLATQITTHSKRIQTRAEKHCPTHLVPQGFDADLFRPNPDQRESDRSRFGFSSDDFVVGHLCTFTTGGTLDLDTILESWSQPSLAKAKFLLIGGGPTESSVRNAISKHGLTDRVTLTGLLPHEEIPQALNALDVGVIFMSDREANMARVSFKVIEYLAMNVPVVGQVVGETAFRFGNHVRPATADTLADATAQIAGQVRPETAQTMVEYDWTIAAKGIVKIVQDVFNG